MKNKDLKKLARRIMKLEMTIDQCGEQSKKGQEAKNEILNLTDNINPEDMFTIDEMIQDMLENEEF